MCVCQIAATTTTTKIYIYIYSLGKENKYYVIISWSVEYVTLHVITDSGICHATCYNRVSGMCHATVHDLQDGL